MIFNSVGLEGVNGSLRLERAFPSTSGQIFSVIVPSFFVRLQNLSAAVDYKNSM